MRRGLMLGGSLALAAAMAAASHPGLSVVRRGAAADDTPPAPLAPDPLKEAKTRAERRRIEKAEAKRRRKIEQAAKALVRDDDRRAKAAGRKEVCPRCGSPEPRLHPAVQRGGEVSICPHKFHRQTNQGKAANG